jgi:cobalt-zinc-cadmium efflux system outer membrane protein
MNKFRWILVLLAAAIINGGCSEEDRYLEPFSGDGVSVNAEEFLPKTEPPKMEVPKIVEPDGELTLRRTLALTLMKNPELQAFSLEIRAAQARQLQAGLWPNPELSTEVEQVGGSGDNKRFDGAETTIQLSQLIELGNKSQKRRKVASYAKELSKLDYQSKHLEVFSDAAKAFFAVLEAQEKVKLSDELLKLSKESYNVVEKRVDAGKDSPLERTRASVTMAKIRIEHRKIGRDLDFARKRLASFWGKDDPRFELAVGNLDSVEEPGEIKKMLGQLKLSPEYTRWETEIKKRKAALDVERAKAIGDVTIGAGMKRLNETNDNTIVFGISIPLPVSDRNQGAREAAVINLAKANHEKKAAWLKLQNEFNLAYQELSDAYSLAVALRDEVLPGATEMFDAATRAYRQGKVDYLNVLDAQRTLFQVKNEYIETLNVYHTAKTDIERFINQQSKN